MKHKMVRIQSLLLSCILLFSILLVSCQSNSIRSVRWKNIDVTIQDLKSYTPELIKTTPATLKEKEENKIEEIEAYQFPDKGYYYRVTNLNEMWYLNNHNPWLTQFDNDYFSRRIYDNSYLNPKTLIHPDPKKEEDKFPMELFINQNKETVSVNKDKDIYIVYKNKQEISKGKILTYQNPWIVLTDGVADRTITLWQYTLINTDTNKTYTISVPGKIASVRKLLQGLLFEVIEQSFYKASKWLYTPEKQTLEQIGSEHVEAITVGDTSWIVFWDWWDNIAKVYRYDTGKVVEIIDFGKYVVRSILPYQDQKKNWNLWIIPTLTYEKFTSNVFWMPLTTRRTTISNLDFHKELFVSKALIDSTDRLLLFVHDQKKDSWTAGKLNSFLFLSPKGTKAYNLPIDGISKGINQTGYLYGITGNSTINDRIKNDLDYTVEGYEQIVVPVTVKINRGSIDYQKLYQETHISPGFLKQYPDSVLTPIKNGKVSQKDNTITWDMKITYNAKYEYKIPILTVVPKI